jgi:uncharacterized protein YdiU (UPF0061 family)
MSQAKSQKSQASGWDYSGISSINGDHPLKDRVPFGYIEYEARKRKQGRVLYFNFRLAKEMGLIPEDHPQSVNPQLSKVLLDTFSIMIINEYDFINETSVPKKDKKDNRYMATRYLQLQHPNKQGYTSGDGRSLWNGVYKGRGRTWDISSCGTGATCLSPAAAIKKKFFKSGDPSVSYGCGYAQRDEGINQAVFGEILHRNGVPTERTLAVIDYPNGYAVNVRVGENLLRPSHFFNHLKQGRHDRTKNVIDYYIERQISNKDWPKCPKNTNIYDHMLTQFCKAFAEMSARFESEYIFCWLDWDGDNILANGAIIDYGSIRQFGLFHKDYRFDDGPRFSTSILEQRAKARHTIQTFAQLRDFLVREEKRPLKDYANHKILSEFDRVFDRSLRQQLLERVGFEPKDVEFLLEKKPTLVNKFMTHFHAFERTTSTVERKVADGITRDAIFCMRDVLRELPRKIAETQKPFDADEFIEVAKSSYAKSKDLEMTPTRLKHMKEFQNSYIMLIESASSNRHWKFETLLGRVIRRSDVINRYERVTGDAMIHVVDRLLKHQARLGGKDFHQLVYDLIDSQVLDPDQVSEPYEGVDNSEKKNKRIVQNYMRLIKMQREGI